MKRLLPFILALLAYPMLGQNTQVSATITSANGILYQNCSYNISLVSSTGQDISTSPVFIGGIPFNVQTIAGNCDSTGTLTASILSNTSFTAPASPNPNGTQYRFTIVSRPSDICPSVNFSGIFTVTGTTLSLTSGLSALAPPIICNGGGGTGIPGGNQFSVQYNAGSSTFGGAAFNGLGYFSTTTIPRAATSSDIDTLLGYAPLANITGLVTPGSNVTITGSGTSGSPYSISSTGGGDTITSPSSSLSVGGTSTDTTLDINLAHANTWTTPQQFTGIGSLPTIGNCTLSDNYNAQNPFCNLFNPIVQGTVTQSGNEGMSLNGIDCSTLGPGRNAGTGGGTNNVGWTSRICSARFYTFLQPGIKQGEGGTGNVSAIGDYYDRYRYAFYSCGATDGSFQGCGMDGQEFTEYQGYFTGTAPTPTVVAGCAPAASGCPLANTVTLQFVTTGGVGPPTAGTTIHDLTTGVTTGCVFAGSATAFNSSAPPIELGTIPFTGCTPPTLTAVATLNAAVGDTTQQYTSNIGRSQTLAVTAVSGYSATFGTPDGSNSAANFVCIVGGDIEDSRVTSLSGGMPVVNVRKYHPAGSFVLQGAACAPYRALAITVDNTAFGAQQPSSFWAFGSDPNNPTHLLFANQWGGQTTIDIFRTGETPATTTSAFTLEPMAEIVANNSVGLNAPALIQAEDNGFLQSGGVGVAGDSLIDPHYPTVATLVHNYVDDTSQYGNGSAGAGFELMRMIGPKITDAYQPYNFLNQNPCAMYIYCGGWATPPQYFMNFAVGTQNLIRTTGPVPNGSNTSAVIDVVSTALGGSDTTPFDVISLPNKSGGENGAKLHYSPATGVSCFTYNSTGVCFDPINQAIEGLNGDLVLSSFGNGGNIDLGGSLAGGGNKNAAILYSGATGTGVLVDGNSTVGGCHNAGYVGIGFGPNNCVPYPLSVIGTTRLDTGLNGYLFATAGVVTAVTGPTATNLSGGALGSAPYQSAANTTAFIASPTTTAHTFFYGWQPSGSAIAPTAIDFATYLASPAAIGGTTPAPVVGTTLAATGLGVSALPICTTTGGQLTNSGCTISIPASPYYWDVQGVLFSTATMLGPVFKAVYNTTAQILIARLSGTISCTVAPTINLMDLGTSPSTVYGSATSVGSLSTGTSDGLYSNLSLGATIVGTHYYGIAFSAGTCVTAPTVDISATF